MAKPWEKYQKAEATESGPWTKYAKDAPLKSEDSPGLISSLVGGAQDVGQSALEGVGKLVEPVLKPYEKYVSGPIRAGLIAGTEEANKPGEKTLSDVIIPKGFIAAAKGAYNAIGKEEQPSFKAEIEKGAPDWAKKSASEAAPGLFSNTGEGWKLKKGGILDVSPTGVAGGIGEAIIDPLTMVAPEGKILKAAEKPMAEIVNLGKSAKKIVGGAISDTAASATKKAGHALTGVAEKDIDTFIKRTNKVEDMAKKYGDDVQSAVDDARLGILDDVKSARQDLNNKISKEISTSGDKIVSSTTASDSLNNWKKKLNKVNDADEIRQIDKEIQNLKQLADENGDILASDLFSSYNRLKKVGSGAFQEGGQLFVPGSSAQKAAKDASREIRKVISSELPETSEALRKLSLLHKAEDTAGKGLLKEGAPAAQFATAGRSNTRQRKALGQLEAITGSPITQKAEDVAAMQSFGNPSVLPVDQTGKSLTRMGVGTGAGLLLGGTPGAVVGTIATSPMALKYGIKAGKVIGNIGEKAFSIPVDALAKTMGVTADFISNPKNAAVVRQVIMQQQKQEQQSKGLLNAK